MKKFIRKAGYGLLILATALSVSTLTSCKKKGCTDPKATNFEEKAKKDDGTCDYDTLVIVRPNLDGLTKVAEFELSDIKTDVGIYAKGDLVTGYNTLYLAATDPETGGVIDDGHFEVSPMMKMEAGHEHGTPVLNSVLSSVDENGLYKVGVYFVMSSMGGQWRLEVEFHNHAESGHGDSSVDIEVKEPSDRISGNFMAMDDSSMLFVCWVMEEDPIVGMNDFSMAIFNRENMMTWTPVNDINITIEPEMPTMGHGSPGNVNPTSIGSGQYKGEVNFTMTGYWKVNIEMTRNSNQVSNGFYFDYTL
jgi:hypothetical protein